MDKDYATLDCLEIVLREKLPQEWLVSRDSQTTCQGHTRHIRIETEFKPVGNQRQLVCFVTLGKNPKEAVIWAPNVTDPLVIKVSKVFSKITITYLQVFGGYYLTLTECLLNCPSCQNAFNFYNFNRP